MAKPAAKIDQAITQDSSMDLNHLAAQILPLLTTFIKALPAICGFLALFKWLRTNANLRGGTSAMDVAYICVGAAALMWGLK